mgnify:CR=1 FL=1
MNILIPDSKLVLTMNPTRIFLALLVSISLVGAFFYVSFNIHQNRPGCISPINSQPCICEGLPIEYKSKRYCLGEWVIIMTPDLIK